MPEYHVSGHYPLPVEADDPEGAVSRAMDNGGWEWEATPWEEHVRVPTKWATELGWYETRTVVLDLHIQYPQQQRRRPNERYMPARTEIRWRRGVDEPEWVLINAYVTGPRLKHDGTESKAPMYDETFYQDGLPEWLVEIVESTRP